MTRRRGPLRPVRHIGGLESGWSVWPHVGCGNRVLEDGAHPLCPARSCADATGGDVQQRMPSERSETLTLLLTAPGVLKWKPAVNRSVVGAPNLDVLNATQRDGTRLRARWLGGPQ